MLLSQTGADHTLRTAHRSFNQPCFFVWVLVYAALGQMAVQCHVKVVLMTWTIIPIDYFTTAESPTMPMFSGSTVVTFWAAKRRKQSTWWTCVAERE